MKESERTLAKNTFFLYVMQISGYVFPLLTFPYLPRVLGAERYGTVVFANAVMQYFSMLLEFGFILSATRTCSECRDDRAALGEVWLKNSDVIYKIKKVKSDDADNQEATDAVIAKIQPAK